MGKAGLGGHGQEGGVGPLALRQSEGDVGKAYYRAEPFLGGPLYGLECLGWCLLVGRNCHGQAVYEYIALLKAELLSLCVDIVDYFYPLLGSSRNLVA